MNQDQEFFALRLYELAGVSRALLELEDMETTSSNAQESALDIAYRLSQLLNYALSDLLAEVARRNLKGGSDLLILEAAANAKALALMSEDAEDGDSERDTFFGMAHTLHRTLKATESKIAALAYGQ